MSVGHFPQSPRAHQDHRVHTQTVKRLGCWPAWTTPRCLVVLDYHNSSYEVGILRSTVASKVISSMEEIFAPHSLPESLTSDKEWTIVHDHNKRVCRIHGTAGYHTPQGHCKIVSGQRFQIASMKRETGEEVWTLILQQSLFRYCNWL